MDADRKYYWLILISGITALFLVLNVWHHSLSALLGLFMLGLIFPLTALFGLFTLFLSIHAIHSKNTGLIAISGISILLIVIWVVVFPIEAFPHSNAKFSFTILMTFAYAVICIGYAMRMFYIHQKPLSDNDYMDA